MASGIYAITCTVTGEVYVGFSKNIERRWDGHKAEMRGVCNRTRHPRQYISCNKNVLLSCATHAFEDFSFEVLELCETKDLRQKEAEWLHRLNPSFNVCKPAIESDRSIYKHSI